MFNAYVRADSQEDTEVMEDLYSRLKASGITPLLTPKSWKEIRDPVPFLYFRTPYLRFDGEIDVLKFHMANSHIPYLLSRDGEVISVSFTADRGSHAFITNVHSSLYEPATEPLPVLFGTHKRPEYLQLTLNSLLHSFRSSKQKLYIVASQPDEKSKDTILRSLENTKVSIEAVITENNLGYAAANFGSKFFKLDKFLHYEDDGILPENTHHLLPYWTSQLNHRSTTAGWTSMRISDINWTSDFLKSPMVHRQEYIDIPKETLWYYAKPSRDEIVPIGGLGCVINSATMYKNFNPPEYRQSEATLYFDNKVICIANVPIFHMGSNIEVDYPEYFKNRNAGIHPNRLQKGTNMKTGETKEIDLGANWADT